MVVDSEDRLQINSEEAKAQQDKESYERDFEIGRQYLNMKLSKID